MSVLGDLFSDIAEAIRSKNGAEGVTYKPAEFPQKILNIPTGGASGDRQVTITTGKFFGNGGTMTVTHDLGICPDIIMVYASHIVEPPTIMTSIGLCQAIMNAIGADARSPTGVYNEYGIITIYNFEGMESAGSELAQSFGAVRNVTSQTFQVGAPDLPAVLDKQYVYIAISGLI